ncbi:MAG: ABC transporter permease [Planctomycetes bacterium]|nr:ABC transporter permease [Planctomycetota bacterium]
MSKIWTVAIAEYVLAVKTKAFVISVILMPILMGGMIALKPLLENNRDISDQKIAVVDRSGGELVAALATAAEKRNAEGIREKSSGEQIHPRYLVEAPDAATLAGKSDPEIQLALADRVRNGELHAYLWIESGVIEAAPTAKASFHARSTSGDLRQWLGAQLTENVQRKRFEGEELDALKKKLAPVAVVPQELAVRTAEGTIQVGVVDTKGMQTGVGVGLGMLLFMLIMSGAPRQLNCVVEEKMNRVSEVLLGSVPPFDLMMGKLISSVGVSLTLGVLYVAGGYGVLNHFDLGALLDPQLFVWFTLYTIAGVFLFGSLFTAIGAACNDLNDAQSLITPVMLVVMLPMFVWPQVIEEPNSSFAMIASLVPFATPMLMVTRQAIPPGPLNAWEPYLGLALCVAMAIFCVFAAGRIFRVGLLSHGQAPKLTQLVKWVFKS